jgi:hypothetical protein
LDAAGILELLQANRVPHVAADAIELVAQDGLDLLLLGIGPYPGEHLVEDGAFGAPLGRLRHDELAGDLPANGLCPVAGHPQLGVDRIPFALLAG